MPTGFSLHIGINEVDPAHYGSALTLKGCENDAAYYRGVAERIGIRHIRSLLSRKATVSNLLAVFEDYAKAIAPGDLFFMTYSGHGGSMKDFNYDEKDLRDETWCLYDRQFLDDELFYHLNRMPQGVRILVVSDSCHSGTVVRSENDLPGPEELASMLEQNGMPNSEDPVCGSGGLCERYIDRDTINAVYERNKALYDAVIAATPPESPSNANASILLLAACQDDEKALEFNGAGVFTTSLRTMFEEKLEDFTDYQEFFDAVLKSIPVIPDLRGRPKRLQTPKLTSDGNLDGDFKGERPFRV